MPMIENNLQEAWVAFKKMNDEIAKDAHEMNDLTKDEFASKASKVIWFYINTRSDKQLRQLCQNLIQAIPMLKPMLRGMI
jgi:hypothetical protein